MRRTAPKANRGFAAAIETIDLRFDKESAVNFTRFANSFAGLFGALLFAVLPQLTAGAQEPARAHEPPPAAPVPLRPSDKEREDFHAAMATIRPPGKGCFTAQFPTKKWVKTQCASAPKFVNPVARGARPNSVGAGTDDFATVATGNISSATGSFDSVTGATAEYGNKLGDLTTVHPNIYALQLNSNTFSTTACSGSTGCSGWEQFIYSQTQCSGACVFIEYWLLNHTSPCPSTGGWTFYAGSSTTTPGCFVNTAATSVPVQALTDFSKLKLTGAVSGGTDTLTLSTASGTVYTNTNTSIANLGQGWTGAEYNVVGDCCAAAIYFTNTTSIGVRLQTSYGSTTAPTCASFFSGATAETNNLNLTGACVGVSGASPAITFTESGGGPIPPGITVGDPHLTNFHGVHFDFQHAGEFLLVQSDPDLTVQTRQAMINSSVAVNTGVGVKMGSARVALCLSGLEVDGTAAALPDGASKSLVDDVVVGRRGNVYVISRPSGDIVQATSYGDHIDVSVTLGATNTSTVRGLLGSGALEHRFALRDGTVLKASLAFADSRLYADSWRVAPADSLLCGAGKVEPRSPERAFTAADLEPRQREQSRAVCLRAGVARGQSLEDCMLDVSVLGKESAADAFVHIHKRPKELSVLQRESELKR
jgi:hypothetical protein